MPKKEQIALEQLAEITPGPSGSLLEKLGEGPDGVPVVTPSAITDRYRVDTRNLRRLPYGQAARLDRFVLRQDDIVLVRQGIIGRLALIGPRSDGWLYNSSCARVRSRDHRVLPEYLWVYLSSTAAQGELIRRTLSGTVPSLNAKSLGSIPVVVPPLDRQRAVAVAVADVDELASIHQDTAERLDVLRTTLLDELLGEV